MSVRRIVVCGLVVALAAGVVARVDACSCLPDERPTDVVRQEHAAVFAGTVVNVTKIARKNAAGLIREDVEVRLRVERSWKGPPAEEAVVTTAVSGALCGYHFERGRTYLVWARGDGGRLAVSLCSRTQPLETAGDEIARLGKPEHTSKR